ncbi:MAG: epoxyqueuosine reductase QueH [Caldisericia bacterium]|nr:epoxyqueuosine reductase QueH [Caldisericia bacterium]MDD4614809.1 epoxyqueuosine reductase QueH [Caldisericia bacterium]
MKPTLLLHICCAPCAIVPLQDLMQDFSVVGFFYNPNIHPLKEYLLRKEATFQLGEDFKIPMLYGDYPYRDFLHNTLPVSATKDRCTICYSMRMKETYHRFLAGNFQYSSSTLFFSPYQNHDTIRKQVWTFFSPSQYIVRDWSTSYQKGTQEARDRGYYRQSYCGCIFSNEDRYSKSKKR